MKKWYQSKTLWFALLYGLVSIAGIFGWADYQPSADTLEIVGVVVAAITLVLRLVTKQGVEL